MGRKRSAWSRINAWLDFEVPAESLEAYRRARALVEELGRQVEDRRLACVVDGLDPWSMPPGTRAGFLCAWNATVLQALGDALVEADAADNPRTAGFVPRPLHDEAAAYYAGVEAWLDRAQQAFANPGYRLDLPVPDRLPVPAADPFPVLGLRDSRARGLLAALRAVRDGAAAAMALLPENVADPARRAQLRSIRRQHLATQAAAGQVEALHETACRADVERVVADTRRAIAHFYALGQRIADPALAEPQALPLPEPAPPPSAPVPGTPRMTRSRDTPTKPPRLDADGAAGAGRPVPGPMEFDVWCLTDPAARRYGQADIDALWGMWEDDGPRARALHGWIAAELACGHVELAMNGAQRARHWFRCPWGPVYVARHTVYLDGLRIPVNQRFVLDAHPENAGRPVRISCRLVARDPDDAPAARPRGRRHR